MPSRHPLPVTWIACVAEVRAAGFDLVQTEITPVRAALRPLPKAAVVLPEGLSIPTGAAALATLPASNPVSFEGVLWTALDCAQAAVRFTRYFYPPAKAVE